MVLEEKNHMTKNRMVCSVRLCRAYYWRCCSAYDERLQCLWWETAVLIMGDSSAYGERLFSAYGIFTSSHLICTVAPLRQALVQMWKCGYI